MGQSDDIPWRLLKIDIAVEDKYVGAGKALVHHLQVEYVHELVQSRLLTNEDPLVDLYQVLHSFCLSLKVEVLEAQAYRLLRHRWGRLIHIDEYHPGNKVVLSYWRTAISKTSKPDPMTICIHQERKGNDVALKVTHKPALILQNVDLVQRASAVKDLSLERLLGDTILVRSYHKLHAVQQTLRKHVKNDASRITERHSCLVIPLTERFESPGDLHISVDPQTGAYVCASPGLGRDVLDEIESAVNESPAKLVAWIPRLTFVFARERCKDVLQALPARYVEKLPLTNYSTHAVGKLGNNVIYIKMTAFENFYVVAQIIDDELSTSSISCRYLLLRVVKDGTNQHGVGDYKADALVELNSDLLDRFDLGVDRKFRNSELSAVVSACDARIPFIGLTRDLVKEGLAYQGLLPDSDAGFCLKLLNLEPIAGATGADSLVTNTLQCAFRYRCIEKVSKSSDAVGARVWYAELVFAENPMKIESKQDSVTRLTLKLDVSNADSPVQAFKEAWKAVGKLYEVVGRFADVLYDRDSSLGQMVSVHSYDFQSLVLKYGARRKFTLSVTWSHHHQNFSLHFGRVGSIGFNSHSYSSHYLTAMFNDDNDLGKLVQVLHDTSDPFHVACSISSFPVLGMGIGSGNAKSVSDNFTVLVQSPWRFLMVYRSLFALEVCCMAGRRVALRDGALSKCDSSVVKDGLQPIPGLVNFLTALFKSAYYAGPTATRADPPSSDQGHKTLNGVDVRTIPHGNWAGNSPVIIGHVDFVKLLREQKVNSQTGPCVLEHFMGLTSLKTDMTHMTQTNDAFYFPDNVNSAPAPSEISCLEFAVNSVHARCSLQASNESLGLVLKLQPAPAYTLQQRGLPQESWRPENLLILERFFQLRVATHPYRSNNMHSFCLILAAKWPILNDFMGIMRLELSDHKTDMVVRWLPQLCLTVPPKLAMAVPCAPAVFIKDKVLIVMTFVPKNVGNSPASRQAVVTPIVLQPNGGGISVPAAKNNPHNARMDAFIKQYMDNKPHNTRTHLSSVVKYIMDNYSVG